VSHSGINLILPGSDSGENLMTRRDTARTMEV
jgi:hypothetical protein